MVLTTNEQGVGLDPAGKTTSSVATALGRRLLLLSRYHFGDATCEDKHAHQLGNVYQWRDWETASAIARPRS